MMKLDHTALWVSDLEREKEFFVRYFDCYANDIYVNPVKKYSSNFIIFNGGGRLEIMKREGMETGAIKEVTGYAHIAINVGSRDNVDKLTEKLKRDGIAVISGPRITGDGYYESVILDPGNNRIEIVSK